MTSRVFALRLKTKSFNYLALKDSKLFVLSSDHLNGKNLEAYRELNRSVIEICRLTFLKDMQI